MSTVSDAAELAVRQLSKSYGGNGRGTHAIEQLDFEVAPGELLCVVGPSGCGKTTLLKCMAGLSSPSSGVVSVDGAEVAGPPEGTAVVFQEYGRSLFPWSKVRDNVALPLRDMGLSKSQRSQRVNEALESVGLSDEAGSYPWQLSGGMQQRVAIARAIACRPRLLLMDEPFAAVDAQTRADLEDLIRRLWTELGVTIVFVTHDIDESVYLAQRVLVLSRRPTMIREDIDIDLPAVRDQISTRADPHFVELRTRVYELIRGS